VPNPRARSHDGEIEIGFRAEKNGCMFSDVGKREFCAPSLPNLISIRSRQID
jgi:hypothetical protein